MQLRLLMSRFLLRPSDDVGPTWHARGLSAAIDFVLVRHPGMLGVTTSRADIRLALPSDHDMVQVTFSHCKKAKERFRPGNNCGRWGFDGGKWTEAFQQLPEGHDHRDLEAAFTKVRYRRKVARYVDSPEIKELIRQRKIAADASLRMDLTLQITQLRAEGQEAHKKDILERALHGHSSFEAKCGPNKSLGIVHPRAGRPGVCCQRP